MGTHPIFESDFDCLTEFVNNVDRANVHRDQARRRPARIGRQDHQAVRAERLQTRGNEIVQARKGTLGDALRRPQVQALLRWACQLHELWANLRDGVGGFERGQNGPHDAARRTRRLPFPARSAATFPSRSDATFATGRTRSNPPTTRSASGSNRKSSSPTTPAPPHGSTNNFRRKLSGSFTVGRFLEKVFVQFKFILILLLAQNKVTQKKKKKTRKKKKKKKKKKS